MLSFYNKKTWLLEVILVVWRLCTSGNQDWLRAKFTFLLLSYRSAALLDYACVLLHQLSANLGLIAWLTRFFVDEALRLRIQTTHWRIRWLLYSECSWFLQSLLHFYLEDLLLGLSDTDRVIDCRSNVFADRADTSRSHSSRIRAVFDGSGSLMIPL